MFRVSHTRSLIRPAQEHNILPPTRNLLSLSPTSRLRPNKLALNPRLQSNPQNPYLPVPRSSPITPGYNAPPYTLRTNPSDAAPHSSLHTPASPSQSHTTSSPDTPPSPRNTTHPATADSSRCIADTADDTPAHCTVRRCIVGW